MARQAVKVTGKRVLDAFSEYYLDATGEKFRPNYGMIVMAEKLTDYWTMPDILSAMQYYFSTLGKKDYYEFMNKLDAIYKASTTQLEQDVWFSELEKETTKLVKEIYKSRRGEGN